MKIMENILVIKTNEFSEPSNNNYTRYINCVGYIEKIDNTEVYPYKAVYKIETKNNLGCLVDKERDLKLLNDI